MKIHIPVGIVASGKSAACREWAKKHDAIIVEADKFRTLFHDQYMYVEEEEDLIFRLVVESVAWWASYDMNVAVDDAVFFLRKYDRAVFQMELTRRLSGIVPFVIEWDFLPVPTDEQVEVARGCNGRGFSVKRWLEVARDQREELEYE